MHTAPSVLILQSVFLSFDAVMHLTIAYFCWARWRIQQSVSTPASKWVTDVTLAVQPQVVIRLGHL